MYELQPPDRLYRTNSNQSHSKHPRRIGIIAQTLWHLFAVSISAFIQRHSFILWELNGILFARVSADFRPKIIEGFSWSSENLHPTRYHADLQSQVQKKESLCPSSNIFTLTRAHVLAYTHFWLAKAQQVWISPWGNSLESFESVRRGPMQAIERLEGLSRELVEISLLFFTLLSLTIISHWSQTHR